jgi:hypothetical protein
MVLSDPDPLGGFPKGAIISGEQKRYMLKDNTFTIGTKMIQRGICYIVMFANNGRQELRAI